mmetsp:Transcript_36149/g.95998  ORF Transcript_36149/g.95998 Transcript_36149/m.95998 type:complete len:207 (-) Transcript_36149:613-1233(-)
MAPASAAHANRNPVLSLTGNFSEFTMSSPTIRQTEGGAESIAFASGPSDRSQAQRRRTGLDAVPSSGWCAATISSDSVSGLRGFPVEEATTQRSSKTPRNTVGVAERSMIGKELSSASQDTNVCTRRRTRPSNSSSGRHSRALSKPNRSKGAGDLHLPPDSLSRLSGARLCKPARSMMVVRHVGRTSERATGGKDVTAFVATRVLA